MDVTRKPTIGYLTTSLSSRGGWDRCALGVIPEITAWADVIVLTRTDIPNEIKDMPGITIRAVFSPSMTFGFRNQIRIFLYIWRHLRHADAIHCMMEPYAPAAAMMNFLYGIPTFITLAGTYAVPPQGYTPRKIVKRALMRFMYRYTTCINSGSERAVRRAAEVVPVGPWRFIPNGVNASEFYPTQKLFPHPFLFTVGEVKPRKGQLFTVRAMALLKDVFPDLHYKIVGNTEKSKEYVAEIKQFAEKEGIGDRVEFLGRMSDEEMRQLYSGCEAFVLAAQTIEGSFEGFPMVFYEAQACGAPIISTHGFGSDYVVTDAYNGYLVNEGDIEPLAKVIEKIVGNPSHKKALRENSVTEGKKHTWRHTAECYMSMYREFIPMFKK